MACMGRAVASEAFKTEETFLLMLFNIGTRTSKQLLQRSSEVDGLVY